MATQDQGSESSSGCLLRLFWLLLGNAMLVIVAIQIPARAGGSFTGLDALYWLFVLMILAARYADIRYYKGTTAEGKPSTLEDWRRHAFVLVLVAGAAWLAAHVWGYVRLSI
jgi:hypothetical protein